VHKSGKNDEELARLAREFARAKEQWAELRPQLEELAAASVRVSEAVMDEIESIDTRPPMGGVALHHFQRA
jgi:predicted  nucleic acid-binding Zn-ribbon protein